MRVHISSQLLSGKIVKYIVLNTYASFVFICILTYSLPNCVNVCDHCLLDFASSRGKLYILRKLYSFQKFADTNADIVAYICVLTWYPIIASMCERVCVCTSNAMSSVLVEHAFPNMRLKYEHIHIVKIDLYVCAGTHSGMLLLLTCTKQCVYSLFASCVRLFGTHSYLQTPIGIPACGMFCSPCYRDPEPDSCLASWSSTSWLFIIYTEVYIWICFTDTFIGK